MKRYLQLVYVFIFLCSCTQSAYLDTKRLSDEYGKIEASITSKTHPGSVTFHGKYRDIETGEVPPASAVILIDSTGYLLNKDGIYSITLKHKEYFHLSTFTHPYFPITTGIVKVKPGKVYRVDFYLKEDTKPFID